MFFALVNGFSAQIGYHDNAPNWVGMGNYIRNVMTFRPAPDFPARAPHISPRARTSSLDQPIK
jgi:hypothetical protein